MHFRVPVDSSTQAFTAFRSTVVETAILAVVNALIAVIDLATLLGLGSEYY
jgi:hypothetical protein